MQYRLTEITQLSPYLTRKPGRACRGHYNRKNAARCHRVDYHLDGDKDADDEAAARAPSWIPASFSHHAKKHISQTNPPSLPPIQISEHCSFRVSGCNCNRSRQECELVPGVHESGGILFREHNKKGDLGDLGMIPLPKIGGSGSFSL